MPVASSEGEEWDEKFPPYQNQPPPYQDQPQRVQVTETRSDHDSEDRSKCPKCCLKTRNCLMSAECSRALQISSVIALCGMCLRFFV